MRRYRDQGQAVIGWRYWLISRESSQLDTEIAAAQAETTRLHGIIQQVQAFEHHRARCSGEVLADFKSALIDARDAALLNVGNQVAHAVGDAFRLRFDRLLDDFRIGCREIRRAHRIRILARIEAQLHFGAIIDVGIIDEIAQEFRVDQVGLL